MNDRNLTAQEQRDRDQLAQWMTDNGVNVKLLADATGVSSNYIYMMTKSDRTISEAFKWRSIIGAMTKRINAWRIPSVLTILDGPIITM